jgi:hypothetical protein
MTESPVTGNRMGLETRLAVPNRRAKRIDSAPSAQSNAPQAHP